MRKTTVRKIEQNQKKSTNPNIMLRMMKLKSQMMVSNTSHNSNSNNSP